MSTQLKHAIDVKQNNCNKCVNIPATYNIWLMENLVVVAYHLLLDATGIGENCVTNTIFGIQQQLPSKVQSDLEPSTIFNWCMIRSKACTKPFSQIRHWMSSVT